MTKPMTLAQYVKKRNGVPMGAPGSMSNMLKNSFGARSFDRFWHYWNPIWGYYLSRKVMKPLSRFLPIWLAIILTFAVSGALHDAAISLLKWQVTWLFTPWFTLMGILVVFSKALKIHYSNVPWGARVTINLNILIWSWVLI